MSEKNVLGVASSVLEVSDLAAKVSVRLFTLSRKIKDAIKPVEALSKDIALTGAVLNQLGRHLKKGEDVQVGSSTLVTSIDDLVEECSNIFDSIDKALDGDNTGSRVILGLQHHVHLTSLEPLLALLETNLERLKTPLALMLNVLIYADQLKGQEERQLVKEQQELIKVLNEERKENERRFHKLSTETKPPLAVAAAPEIIRKALPSLPVTRNLEAIDEEPRAKTRVWIREESPERENSSMQIRSSDISGNSTTPQMLVKSHSVSATSETSVTGRDTGRDRTQTTEKSADIQDDDLSLLDMASFLRSTGPDSPRSSGDSFSLNTDTSIMHTQNKPREPVARGDNSNLIDFFREGTPRALKSGAIDRPRANAPVHRVVDPAIPPTIIAAEPVKLSSSPHLSPVQSRLRSHSAGLLSPLGSHPPESRTETSSPAAKKWPLHAVLNWLEKNSFSSEWQQTFSVLQIEGTEFVELESGQSIRKMLTVVYPQLAKECSQSGKGWNQARERAEGQRLRKLIRELPVNTKYEEKALTVRVNGTDENPSTKSPTNVISALAFRRRAATSPTKETPKNLTQTNQSKASSEANVLRAHIVSLPARVEKDQVITPPPLQVEKKVAGSHRCYGAGSEPSSTVSDEWVRKWTVLSSEEIARGREVAQTGLMA